MAKLEHITLKSSCNNSLLQACAAHKRAIARVICDMDKHTSVTSCRCHTAS